MLKALCICIDLYVYIRQPDIPGISRMFVNPPEYKQILVSNLN